MIGFAEDLVGSDAVCGGGCAVVVRYGDRADGDGVNGRALFYDKIESVALNLNTAVGDTGQNASVGTTSASGISAARVLLPAPPWPPMPTSESFMLISKSSTLLGDR